MAEKYTRDFIGGAMKLLLFGIVIYILIAKVIMRQIELIYPYITYEMVDAIYLYLILCFAIPGILLFVLAVLEKKEIQNRGTNALSIITGCLSIASIIGIRVGIKAFSLLKSDRLEKADESNSERIQEEGFKAYRFYLVSTGAYLLVFGLFFLALINFLLVITLPLLYPTLSQPIVIGLEIWFIMCLIVPAILFIILSLMIKQNPDQKLFEIHKKIIAIGGILSIGSIFGISGGINLIRNTWMLAPFRE